MKTIVQGQRLMVQQKKQWGEILTGFEAKNRYGLVDETNTPVGAVAEESGLAGRLFLSSARACKLHVYDKGGAEVGYFDKPFRWFFQEMSLVENGRRLGCVRRRFGLLRRRFTIEDANGQEIFEISAPVWRPWTFPVLKDGQQVAVISKKWSGLGKEMFTSADNFGIEFSAPISEEHRKLLLMTVFLIDLCCFEKKG